MRKTSLLAVLFAAFTVATARGAKPAVASERIPVSKGQHDAAKKIVWYDLQVLSVEGRGWSDTKMPYDRLPAKAEKMVRPVIWDLSRKSAGICAKFITDASTIQVRWNLTSPSLAMPHMPATGMSGLDLYVRHEGKWRWLAVARPTKQKMEAELISGLPAGEHEFLLYLPLYNGVSSVEIGLPENSTLKQVKPSGRKPILFYGTSITQGGCASRPGMVHTAILGRWLEYPVINLGFSGKAIMEPEVADLVAELDPAVFVLDSLPNMTAEMLNERAVPFIKKIRQAHPETPILMVEDRTYPNAYIIKGSQERNDTSRAAFRKAYEQLQKEGFKNITYLEGKDLIGDDGEGTVDNSHPTDLGFMRQAKVFEGALKPLLPTEAAK